MIGIKDKFQKTLTKHLRQASMVVSQTKTTYAEPDLPGGTASLTLDKWNSRIMDKLYDSKRMGRWTGVTYRMTATKKLHVVTAYRVTTNTITINNSLSSYSQQYMHMIAAV